ncbi:hypothetical protein [Brumimicrobium mesophilum]|uniref:hypothetical protein n=1 Tax=Brumimicrobium mesophilum TaxID=392717 RepID=UPI000D143A88|nr:hypothetical protein [Brumimicrobium mesophilum]
MKPNSYFKNDQIIRDNEFLLTYAVGQTDMEYTIAYANDLKVLKSINDIPNISSIITTTDLSEFVNPSKGLIISQNPQNDFYLLHNFMIENNYMKPLQDSKIDESAIISPTSRIGENVVIGKNVVIKDYAIIESNVVIKDNCEIEQFAVIGANSMQRTIIDGKLFQLKYAGGVEIGERTRVLTGAIIQKPYQAFYTKIGHDSVISTRVVIGHGSKVGNRTFLSGGSGIAGNCIIGDEVWIGGGAIVSDGINIGDNAKVLIGSVVVRNVMTKSTVSGNFALDHKKNILNQVKLRQ